MDKAQGINAFWNSFQWKAFDENTVPDGAMATYGAYVTYNVSIARDFEATLSVSASLWQRSRSWAEVEQKAAEIYDYIGLGGRTIAIDGGYLWIKRGNPFSQRLQDEDDSIRRVVLNIMVDFLAN